MNTFECLSRLEQILQILAQYDSRLHGCWTIGEASLRLNEAVSLAKLALIRGNATVELVTELQEASEPFITKLIETERKENHRFYRSKPNEISSIVAAKNISGDTFECLLRLHQILRVLLLPDNYYYYLPGFIIDQGDDAHRLEGAVYSAKLALIRGCATMGLVQELQEASEPLLKLILVNSRGTLF